MNRIDEVAQRTSGKNGYKRLTRTLPGLPREYQTRTERLLQDERRGRHDERLAGQLNRQPAWHQRKWQLEFKCAQLQDMMEEQGHPAEEIEEKVINFRKENRMGPAPSDTPTEWQTNAERLRQPYADIPEHQRQRLLEVKCAQLPDMMEEQGYSAEEIEEKVINFRKEFMMGPAPSDTPTLVEDSDDSDSPPKKRSRKKKKKNKNRDGSESPSPSPRREKKKSKKKILFMIH